MQPSDVIAEIEASGLRGRGGAGFPTGMKWKFVSKIQSEKKYVVCNADESEPGTFKDRVVFEGDPHPIIEAMTIAAYAVGADEGYLYIRGEYASGAGPGSPGHQNRRRKWDCWGRTSSTPVLTLICMSILVLERISAVKRPL